MLNWHNIQDKDALGTDILAAVDGFDPGATTTQTYLASLSERLIGWESAAETQREESGSDDAAAELAAREGVTIGELASFDRFAERVRAIVRDRPDWQARGIAVGLGALTPFCSCSSVPLFIGFVEAGIPLGVTFSFLIASPMINEVAAVILVSILGWKLAALYVLAGLVVAWFGGLVMQRFRPERWVEDYVWKIQMGETVLPEPDISFSGRHR